MAFSALDERFDQPQFNSRLRWFCEPKVWSLDPARRALRVKPDSPTDFWQKTHYGFRVDTGHLLYADVTGDFDLETRVRFAPVHQYDQAGLMVRVSPQCWLKTSVEFEPHEPSRLGAVVTNHGYSDWSTQDAPAGLDELSFRIQRRGADFLVEANFANRWTQIRLAHLHDLPDDRPIAAGLYACSPRGAGYAAEFQFLRIAPAGS